MTFGIQVVVVYKLVTVVLYEYVLVYYTRVPSFVVIGRSIEKTT